MEMNLDRPFPAPFQTTHRLRKIHKIQRPDVSIVGGQSIPSFLPICLRLDRLVSRMLVGEAGIEANCYSRGMVTWIEECKIIS
jgi:hypothetical protein